jgi:phage terminase small subunit
MVRLAGDFGMTPATRARIAAGVWRERSSEFGDLLGD